MTQNISMEFISLIANSGIQIIDGQMKIDPDGMRKLKFNYIELLDSVSLKFWLEELIEIRQLGKLIQKSALSRLNIKIENINDFENISKIEVSDFKLFMEGDDRVYSVRNVVRTLKAFEKKWIPLPYFKSNNISFNHFGPTDWVRLFYEFDEHNQTIEFALAIDTAVIRDEEVTQNHTPVLNSNPNENKYRICSNEDILMSFMSDYTQCTWVNEWLKSLFKIDVNDSQTKHLATYIHLIRILNESGKMPSIQILSDQSEIIDMDLSIDVGNSHTCAILFETPFQGGGNDFNLNKVKKLKLRSLSNPIKSWSDAFSTRVVFKDETFGMKDSFFPPQKKFAWPSVVRIGFEAEELIHDVELKRHLQNEDKYFNSSPKRYLWDDKPSKSPWKFYDKQEENLKNVYKKGISEQLKSDGTYCNDDAFGAMPLYSRKTLMTFLFLEIFTQAISQFNSFEFRSIHGRPNSKRRLRNVVITCPTGMVKKEQITLRQCADEAVKIITNFNKKINSSSTILNPIISESFDIIPSVLDLRRLEDEPAEDRKDWVYDEATCSQLVFIYGLIQHKFDGDPVNLFKIFGHKNSKNKEVMTIGSLDIGGGTSDLMICEYNLNFTNSTELIPIPQYHEGFHLAGDDLMKNIIQAIIIEGKENGPEDYLCSGVIQNYGAQVIGEQQIIDKINGFFGRDAAAMSYMTQMMRVNFINQIGIPIALRYMGIANSKENIEVGFNEIFKKKTPNKDLLDFFFNHFGFRFEDLRWRLNPNKVNSIITQTFSKLIKQVAKLMHLYNCDFVIISGRPTQFKALENLFLEIHPVQPNRFVNMNNYWIGKWYPFSDNNGFIKDPKTIVSTGALIGLMGSKFFQLNKFKINSDYLKVNLKSTAYYVGQIKENIIKDTSLTPVNNSTDVRVSSLPFHLGMKFNSSTNYPARNLYQIQYNETFVRSLARSRIKDRTGLSLADVYQNIINETNARLPFNFKLTREFTTDKEKIDIEEVTDVNGDELSNNMFILKLITLPKENGYWFDTAEFTLTINNI
jgi:hypothetical protein